MIKLILFRNSYYFLISLSFLLANFEKEFQTKLILVESGDTLEIPIGKQQILGTLSLDGKNNIVIRGMGIDKSILSFQNQEDGAEGLKIAFIHPKYTNGVLVELCEGM